MTAPIGVYIHYPFCSARCPYCDFTSTAPKSLPHKAYADAVLTEITLRLAAQDWSNRRVESIYFGGGTPSLWDLKEIARMIEKITRSFPLNSKVEVTMEINPDQLETSTLKQLGSIGVNRISFGTQSFQQRYLHALGRRHDESDSRHAVEKARCAGFTNISVDLMYGIPSQDPKGAEGDALLAAAMEPDHISAYCLTLHSGTAMHRALELGTITLPDEDESLEIEEAVMSALEAAGFNRYEISSFAREGKEGVHNRGYWTGRECLSLGAGAHGFRLNYETSEMSGLRYSNVPNVDQYLESTGRNEDPTERIEQLGARELLLERMFLGLRLERGVDLGELKAWSGIDPAIVYAGALERMEREGLIARHGWVVQPTKLGLRFNDTLSALLC